MSAIARAAGISRQAVYFHFRDRAALLSALVTHVDDQRDLQAWADKLADASTGGEKLQIMFETQATRNPTFAPVARAIEAARHTDEASLAAWRSATDGRRRFCDDVLIPTLAADGELHPSWASEEASAYLVGDDLVSSLGRPRQRSRPSPRPLHRNHDGDLPPRPQDPKPRPDADHNSPKPNTSFALAKNPIIPSPGLPKRVQSGTYEQPARAGIGASTDPPTTLARLARSPARVPANCAAHVLGNAAQNHGDDRTLPRSSTVRVRSGRRPGFIGPDVVAIAGRGGPAGSEGRGAAGRFGIVPNR